LRQAGLVFMGVVRAGGKWYADSDPGWFGGHWWWVAVTVAAGVVVGLLRRPLRIPERIPSLVADLTDGHVEAWLVPGDRGGVGRLADRRGQRRPGEGSGFDGRRRGQLDRAAPRARRR